MGHLRLVRPGAVCAVLLSLTAASSVTGLAAARSRPKHVRPGCGSACRNLGGLGSGPGTHKARIALLSRRVKVTGGVAPIPIRCVVRVRCRGVLLLVGLSRGAPELARVDLLIPGRTEYIVEVTLSRAGQRYLQRHGTVRALLSAVYMSHPVDSFTLTLTSPS